MCLQMEDLYKNLPKGEGGGTCRLGIVLRFCGGDKTLVAGVNKKSAYC